MSRQIIHTERAPQAIGTYSQAVRVGDTVYLSGQVPLDPATHAAGQRGHRGADPPRVREPQGGGGGGRRLARAGREDQRLSSPTSRTSPRSTRSWRSTARSPTRRARRSASRSCRAARRSRSSASCTSAEGSRRAPRVRPSSARSRRCAAWAQRSPSAWRGSASRASRTCCSCCRCATRTARTWCRSAHCTPGTRAAVEGEVQLTEVAYRGRRQLLCRISDGSGMLTLRFFYFSASQQANLARGTRVRCFGEVRRGPAGARDRAPRVPSPHPTKPRRSRRR